MKNARQVKDLIRNLAKQKDINAQILLRNYLFERLLERISYSEFKNHIILKGGLLVASLVGVSLRSTMDMDATIKGYPMTLPDIERAFSKILSIQLNDGVAMALIKTEVIRDEDDYEGFRLSIEARMDQVRLPLKVDLTTGDQITPKEIDYKFSLLLEERTIEILAYNIETVLAEKLETIISRGTANTRMRDFYDIHVLLKFYEEKVSARLLSKALSATASHRGSKPLLTEAKVVMEEVFQSSYMEAAWTRYQKKYPYAKDISWNMIGDSMIKLQSLIS